MANVPGAEVCVPLAGVVDLARETARLRKEVDSIGRLIRGIEAKFANPDFERRARPEVVENERERLAGFRDKLGRLERQLESLEEKP